LALAGEGGDLVEQRAQEVGDRLSGAFALAGQRDNQWVCGETTKCRNRSIVQAYGPRLTGAGRERLKQAASKLVGSVMTFRIVARDLYPVRGVEFSGFNAPFAWIPPAAGLSIDRDRRARLGRADGQHPQ
jgi:hypothetical protein